MIQFMALIFAIFAPMAAAEALKAAAACLPNWAFLAGLVLFLTAITAAAWEAAGAW